MLVNSTIYDAKHSARFMSADIKNCFLATPIAKAEFMKVQYKHVPDHIQIIYNLTTKVTTDNYVYIRIEKGVYKLKQGTILAYNHLKS